MYIYYKSHKLNYCLVMVMMLVLSGCAHHYSIDAVADPYGLLSGIWHGIIFPLSLFVNLVSWLLSLFSISFMPDIQMIGRPNTGLFFYYIGFAIGLSTSIGSRVNSN